MTTEARDTAQLVTVCQLQTTIAIATCGAVARKMVDLSFR